MKTPCTGKKMRIAVVAILFLICSNAIAQDAPSPEAEKAVEAICQVLENIFFLLFMIATATSALI
jgi:hypothetical protein